MDSEMTPADHEQDLSLELTREILEEVCQATSDSDQRELFEFSSLLVQVVDFQDDSDQSADALRFIRDGLQEIQTLVASDQTNSDRLESLRSEAIERWGELLSHADDSEVTHQQHGADAWGISDEYEAFDEQDDLVAPSAEEISSLLGQLGSTDVVHHVSVGNESDQDLDADQDDCESSSPVQHAPAVETQFSEWREHEPLGRSCQTMPRRRSRRLIPSFVRRSLDDASSCVSSMEESMLKLDSNPSDADALNQICRELHTLKGASASVGLADLAKPSARVGGPTPRRSHGGSRAGDRFAC